MRKCSTNVFGNEGKGVGVGVEFQEKSGLIKTFYEGKYVSVLMGWELYKDVIINLELFLSYRKSMLILSKEAL